jgi:hypothetical protein
MEDVIIPYETGERFFIDGAPMSAGDLARIKVVQEDDASKHAMVDLHYFLQKPKLPRGVTPEDYPTRLDGIFRGCTPAGGGSVIRAAPGSRPLQRLE